MEQPDLRRRRRGLDGTKRGYIPAAVDLTEVVIHQDEGFGRIDVARDGNRRILWPIVLLKKRLHVVEFGGAQIVCRANREPVVRMIGRVERRHERHPCQAVGTVLIVLPALVQHHVALVVEFGCRQRRQQVSHAIRLHPECEFECVLRHHFPVVRAIGVRRSIQRRPGFLKRVEIAAVVMLRSFEHQVLEEMRESCPAGRFILGAHVIPDVDRHNRAPVVLVDENVESVVKRVRSK
jgi:hypothetical protein